MQAKWVPWRLGCGWNLEAAPGIEAAVAYSMSKRNTYEARVPGLKTAEFSNPEDAKDWCIAALIARCERALEVLRT